MPVFADQLVEPPFPKDFYLSYDNMCNVCSLNLLNRPLPLPPPQDKLWMGINKVIDPSVGVNDISLDNDQKPDRMALLKNLSLPPPLYL